jgi:hypothetical protein
VANGANTDKLLELRLTYTWNWFSHHAAQRFAAFNFFLIVVGAVIVAYANAVSHHETTLGGATAGLGSVVAVGFLALDIRNGQLVERAREQLESLEGGELQWPIPTEDKLKRKPLLSHSFWFRAMIVVFLAMAFAGIIWAGAGFGQGAAHTHGHHAKPHACHGQYTSPCSASLSSS